MGKEVEDVLVGCAPTIKLTGTRGDYLKAAIGLQAADGVREYLTEAAAAISRAVDPKPPTVVPRQLGEMRCVLGSTSFALRSFELEFGVTPAAHPNLCAVNKLDGYVFSNDAPTVKLDFWLDASSKVTLMDQLLGRQLRLFLQWGAYAGNPGVGSYWAHEVEITDVEPGDDNGTRTVSVQARVTDDSTRDSSLERWQAAIG
jgi:hypothetical protein